MSEQITNLVLWILGLYSAVGLFHVIRFYLKEVSIVDPAAAHGTWPFKLILIPSLIVFWPFLRSVIRQSKAQTYQLPTPAHPLPPAALRERHGLFILLLAVFLPLLLGLLTPSFLKAWSGELMRSNLEIEPALVSLIQSLPLQSEALWTDQVTCRLWRDSSESSSAFLQLEVEVKKDLDRPALALYWAPGEAQESLPETAIFLGSIWGPLQQRINLPNEARLPSQLGTLYLASMTEGAKIVQALSLELKGQQP